MIDQPNEFSLVSLDEVKQFYGRDDKSGASDDALLTELINRLSTLVENYIGYNVLSREYEEYFDGGGRNFLYPTHINITSVSGCWDSAEWAWDADNLVDSSNYRIHNDGASIVFKSTTLRNYSQNIKLIYTSGTATCPDDLKYVVITEVVRAHKNKGRVDLETITLRDGSVSYVAKNFLPNTVDVLNDYRKVRAV